MLIVRATKKLRQRLGSATSHDGESSTTRAAERLAQRAGGHRAGGADLALAADLRAGE